jgi:hypothetical protein
MSDAQFIPVGVARHQWWRMSLTVKQIEQVARYTLDVSKLVVASVVIGFFVPGASEAIGTGTFVWGILFAGGLFLGGVTLYRKIPVT